MNYQKEYSNQTTFFKKFICSDHSCEEHFHSSFELLYVIEGSILVTMNGQTFTAQKGEFALIFPNMAHYYTTEKSSRCFICLFSEDLVDSFSGLVRGKAAANPIFTLENMQILHHLILYKYDDLLLLRSYLFYVCSQFLCQRPLVATISGKQTLKNQIADYVSGHFFTPLTLKEVAQDLGYNYFYLSRFFSENFNMNFRTFLNQYRISHAQYLLQETDKSITDVALSSGFDTVRSFNRAFMQITQMTPSSYRTTQHVSQIC